jgi:hypothetical protein
MSDILEKLLGVEKDASVLVADAEAEAGRRKAAAQVESQKRYTEALKEKAVEAEARVAAERGKIAAEREEKNHAHRESLASRARDREALRRVVIDFVEKGLR